MFRIPRQIWFWPIAKSAYNAENAQFGLVMPHVDVNYKDVYLASHDLIIRAHYISSYYLLQNGQISYFQTP